jgi:hypothetical protein
MEELREKANNYAEENVINILKEAFAKVYADGYRDGHKDCREEIIVDLSNDSKFVDLGLPSGTLWSREFEQKDHDVLFLPYLEASNFNMPTEEQFSELLSICKWEFAYIDNLSIKYDCIGPNGNVISFYSKGELAPNGFIRDNRNIKFWLYSDNDENEKVIANMYYFGEEIRKTDSMFMGYRLPVRLVKSK